jgi:hypothetical protein
MVTICKLLSGVIMALAAIVAVISVLDGMASPVFPVTDAAAIGSAVVILLLGMIVFLLAESETLFPTPVAAAARAAAELEAKS